MTDNNFPLPIPEYKEEAIARVDCIDIFRQVVIDVKGLMNYPLGHAGHIRVEEIPALKAASLVGFYSRYNDTFSIVVADNYYLP